MITVNFTEEDLRSTIDALEECSGEMAWGDEHYHDTVDSLRSALQDAFDERLIRRG